MALHYQLLEPTATAVPAISGNFLARNRYDLVAHAFYACDLFTGAKRLVKPTMLQAAHLARVNVTYAWAAHRRQAERAAIEAGKVPLVPPPLMKANGAPLTPVVDTGIDDATVVSFVRSVGVARVLEAAVAVEAAQ
jgi:hypothetical protein